MGARGQGLAVETAGPSPPRLFAFGLLLFSLVALGLGAAPARAAQNGAGLVVRHGDGRVIYAYVQFAEPKISGLELLRRAGLTIVSTNVGFGEGVCAIGGEGCPADNCFCKSYGSPSVYWRYYLHRESRWVYASLGPSNRLLGDGDVDGWEWSGGAPQLPAVTIAEIAARVGVTRAAPGALATASPLVPTPTWTPAPPPSAPPAPPSPTRTLAPSVTSTASTTMTPVVPAPAMTPGTPVPTPALPATRLAEPSAPVPSTTAAPANLAPPSPAPAPTTPQPPVTPTAALIGTATLSSSPSPTLPVGTAASAPPVTAGASAGRPASSPIEPTTPPAEATLGATATAIMPEPSARAVVVAPGGETTPLPHDAAAPPTAPPWLGYSAVLALITVLTGYVLVARRRRAEEEQADDADPR